MKSDTQSIALFVSNLGGGGAQRCALTLAHAFAARGHRVHLVVIRPDGPLRNQLSPCIRLVGLKSGLLRLLPVFRRYVLSLNRWSDLANAFAVVTEDDLYRQMLRIPEDPAAVVLGARERPDLLQDATAGAALSDFMERIGFLDMMTRLPDGILDQSGSGEHGVRP